MKHLFIYLSILFFSLQTSLSAQTCDVSLDGVKNYSSLGCGTTLTELGIDDIGSNEELTFDVNLTVNGDAIFKFKANGSEIIVANGVTVTITGNLSFQGSSAPKNFTVNGTLIVNGNLNAQNNIEYGGSGQINVDGDWTGNGNNGSLCVSPCALTFDLGGACTDPNSPICQSVATQSLPITLIGFEATYNAGKLLFHWQTILEENNSFFTIEASKDGENYTAITTEDGAGNHIGLLSYQKEVPFEGYGVYYFRLKQTDTDGKYSYSPSIALRVDSGLLNLKVYRDRNNPQSIYIESDQDHTKVEVLINDALGRVLYHGHITGSQRGIAEKQEIKLQQTSTSFYIVKLVLGNESKIVKI